ncbi:MAG: monofunctional biosynthetic peptidoglycan transglycosylase [Bdellovibrionales bacterium]|jgi:monofunctional glycosyltransferase|nr:monofunctional biosynthetic peptidoglycan transglycosylase [Bdellovibrionales bacterium]
MIVIKYLHFNKITISVILLICVTVSIIPFTKIEDLKSGHIISLALHNNKVYYESSKDDSDWVKISSMGDNIQNAVVVSEDWSFWNHYGVDLIQIYQSFKSYIIGGKKLRGASTITQQVVKNLFLTHERSFKRKILEIVIASYMELRLTKNQILEVYLNIIEYGDGIYGIKNASRHYFQKLPKSLSARESAYLSMLLPNPKVRSQIFSSKNTRLINLILKKMKVAKYLNKNEYKSELENKFIWEI